MILKYNFHYLQLIIMLSLLKLSPAYAQDINKVVDMINQLNYPDNQKCCESRETGSSGKKEQWELMGFANPEFGTIEISPTKLRENTLTHELRTTAIIFRDSGWSDEIMNRRYNGIAKIFAKCGIKILPPETVTVNPPRGILDVEWDDEKFDDSPGTVTFFSNRTPDVTKPVLYFFRSFTNGGVGGAGNKWAKGKKSESTVWTANVVTTGSYKSSKPPDYLTEAHELGHVLLEEGHTQGPPYDIMSVPYSKATSEFTDKQCEKMRKHKTVSKL